MDKITNTYELAKTKISPQEYLEQAKTLLLLNQLDDQDLVHDACIANRVDILDFLKGIPEYEEQANSALKGRQEFHDYYKSMRENDCEKYPEIMKRFREVLHNSHRVGIYEIYHPSGFARSQGYDKNSMSVGGDGLFLFLFEVVSLEEDGIFKLVGRLDDFENPDLVRFCALNNKKEGDVMSGNELLECFKRAW